MYFSTLQSDSKTLAHYPRRMLLPVRNMCRYYEQQDNRGLHIPRPDFGTLTQGAGPGNAGSYSSFFLNKQFAMYLFAKSKMCQYF